MTKHTILVATWSNGLFAISGDEITQEIASRPVRGLAPDGHGGALAIVDGHSLYCRAANGEWTTVATSEFELSCCMAVGDAIYVGTDDARMLRLSNERGVLDSLESFDSIAGRETWFAGSAIVNGERVGPPLGVRSVAASANGRILFANVHVGGIPRSLDGGRKWEPTIEVESDVHEVCAHPAEGNIVAAASAMGLCLSRDGGATWVIEHDGLHAKHCSAVAFSSEDILVSASADPFAAEGRLYRRPVKQAGEITAVTNGLPLWLRGVVHSGCIATKGSMVAIVDRGGNLYVSTDFGKAWSPNNIQIPDTSSVVIC